MNTLLTRPRLGRDGFTLASTMVAVGVAAMGILAITQSMSNSARTQKAMDAKLTALTSAQEASLMLNQAKDCTAAFAGMFEEKDVKKYLNEEYDYSANPPKAIHYKVPAEKFLLHGIAGAKLMQGPGLETAAYDLQQVQFQRDFVFPSKDGSGATTNIESRVFYGELWATAIKKGSAIGSGTIRMKVAPLVFIVEKAKPTQPRADADPGRLLGCAVSEENSLQFVSNTYECRDPRGCANTPPATPGTGGGGNKPTAPNGEKCEFASASGVTAFCTRNLRDEARLVPWRDPQSGETGAVFQMDAGCPTGPSGETYAITGCAGGNVAPGNGSKADNEASVIIPIYDQKLGRAVCRGFFELDDAAARNPKERPYAVISAQCMREDGARAPAANTRVAQPVK